VGLGLGLLPIARWASNIYPVVLVVTISVIPLTSPQYPEALVSVSGKAVAIVAIRLLRRLNPVLVSTFADKWNSTGISPVIVAIPTLTS
jgi:hypothetical protein